MFTSLLSEEKLENPLLYATPAAVESGGQMIAEADISDFYELESQEQEEDFDQQP